MAHLRCEFFSDALAVSTSMTVILPQRTTGQIGMTGQAGDDPPPVLYLLHGLSDDDTTWLRRTSIERYVADRGLAVVMPAVQRSFYTDEACGGQYWTFLSEELPALVDSFFRVSARPEQTFVAGLSMGGYGAFKWALRHPDRFAAAASMSGAVDLGALLPLTRPQDPRMSERLFGGDRLPPEDDLVALVQGSDPGSLPKLWLGCGTADVLYRHNLTFVQTCEAAGVPLTTSFVPDAEHTWDLWDTQIQQVLDWLSLPVAGGATEDRLTTAG